MYNISKKRWKIRSVENMVQKLKIGNKIDKYQRKLKLQQLFKILAN